MYTLHGSSVADAFKATVVANLLSSRRHSIAQIGHPKLSFLIDMFKRTLTRKKPKESTQQSVIVILKIAQEFLNDKIIRSQK